LARSAFASPGVLNRLQAHGDLWAPGQSLRFRYARVTSALPPEADIGRHLFDVRFSNRPFGVKHFQTNHHYSVDVARGLVLLFGIGTKALPSWDSKTRWNNLCGGLAVRVAVGPSE